MDQEVVRRSSFRVQTVDGATAVADSPILDGKEITVDGLTFRADLDGMNFVDEMPE